MDDRAAQNREKVLASIASAQAHGCAIAQGRGLAVNAASEDLDTRPAYQVSLPIGTDMVGMFMERLNDYKAQVLDLRSNSDPVQSAREVATATRSCLEAEGITTVAVHPDYPMEFRPAGIQIFEDHQLGTDELDLIGAAITTCRAAVATTGTILLDHAGTQGRRALTLIPDCHICLIRVDQVHGTLPEAIRSLGPRPISTWISGPSATSDIELDRVEGVHGPRKLIAIIVPESQTSV